MKFDTKVAVVTGGASGMGAATARLLAHEGAAVLIAEPLTAEGSTAGNDIQRHCVDRRGDTNEHQSTSDGPE